MTYSHLIYLDAAQLIARMRRLADMADREAAHKEADAILRCALHKAATGEFTEVEAVALITAFDEVEKLYGNSEAL
jgi:hypothetical protein